MKSVPLHDPVWGTWLPYFVLSGLATLMFSGVLLGLRWPLSIALLIGPTFGIALVRLVDQTDTPTTRTDRVVLITACMIGSVLSAWQVPFGRWVYRSFRDAERRLVDAEAINFAAARRESAANSTAGRSEAGDAEARA